MLAEFVWVVAALFGKSSVVAFQGVRVFRRQNYCCGGDGGGGRIDPCSVLFMGGYATPESDNDRSQETKQEIGGRPIDRSKTHMIFGIRCVETSHQFSNDYLHGGGDPSESRVVGLQPLSDLEEYWGDGTICNENVGDQGLTLRVVLDHLLLSGEFVPPTQSWMFNEEKVYSDDDDHSVFEMVEVGADPIVSVALAKLLSGTTDSDLVPQSSSISKRVVVCHPDEQRLRVLEHAYKYFNNYESDKNPCDFQLQPLRDHLPFVWFPSASKKSVVLFTSPTLVAQRLGEAVAGMISASMSGGGSYQILVPSSIIATEQLEQYDYKVVLGGDAYGVNLWLLEILSAR